MSERLDTDKREGGCECVRMGDYVWACVWVHMWDEDGEGGGGDSLGVGGKIRLALVFSSPTTTTGPLC